MDAYAPHPPAYPHHPIQHPYDALYAHADHARPYHATFHPRFLYDLYSAVQCCYAVTLVTCCPYR